MITELKKYDNGIFEVVANGEMALDDLAKVREFIDGMVADCKDKHCKLFGCVKLNNVSIPKIEFFQKDLGFIDKYKSYIGGMAIIGDEKWEKAWFQFVSNLVDVKIKFFAKKAKSRAKKWLDSLVGSA